MKNIIKRNRNFLFLVFVLSFVVRFLFFQFFIFTNNGFFVCSDSAQYHNVSVNIACGKGIVDNQGKLTTYRVPGYSIFLALFYSLFRNNIYISLFFQILFSSFIPVLVFVLFLVFFNHVYLARLSSVLMILNIGSILHAGLIMSDSFFLLLFLIFLILFFYRFQCFFIRGEKTVNYLQYFLASLVLALISLIRPVGHFLLPVLILYLLFSNFKWKEKLKTGFIFILGWFLLVFPWLFRNYLVCNNFVFHTMSGYHFLNYFAAEVEAKNENILYSEAKEKLLKEWKDMCIRENIHCPLKVSTAAKKVALKYLLKNKVQTLKHSFVNILKTIFSLNSSYLLFISERTLPKYDSHTTAWDKVKRFLFPKTKNLFLKFIIYFEIISLFLMLSGFLFYFYYSFSNKYLFCNFLKMILIIKVLLFLTLGSGVARLRLPMEPLLLIFSVRFYFRNRFIEKL